MRDEHPAGSARPARLRRTLGLGLLTLLLTTLLPVTAHAEDAPCAADQQTACINGTLRTSDGEPAEGVTLEIASPSSSLTVETDEDGRWSVGVSEPGTYSVTLDVATLPEGESLADPAANPRTVEAVLGQSKAALFRLGTPSAGPSPDTSGEASPAPASPQTQGNDQLVRIGQQATSGLIFGLLLALASVGLSLIYGTTGLSNFAHGEQVTLGGIVAYVGCQLLGMPLVVSGVLAVLVGAAVGWAQDAVLWKPLRRRRVGAVQLMIITIGLSIFLQYTIQFFFGASPLRIVTANPKSVDLGGVLITHQSLWSMIIAAVALGGVSYFLLATRLGRATRAVSDNPALAAASGIAVERVIRLVWVLGAGLAALGGVLLGLYFNATAWNMGATILLLMFAATTLGGLGTAFGALAGSIVIGLVAEMSSLVIPSDLRYAGALLILILVLLFRPQGILGRAERIG